MSEFAIIAVGGIVTFGGYLFQWYKESIQKHNAERLDRIKSLLSMFYWPILIELYKYDSNPTNNNDSLQKIQCIIEEQLGVASPKKIIAIPIVKFIKHINNPAVYHFPPELLESFETRTFELQSEYNSLFEK